MEIKKIYYDIIKNADWVYEDEDTFKVNYNDYGSIGKFFPYAFIGVFDYGNAYAIDIYINAYAHYRIVHKLNSEIEIFKNKWIMELYNDISIKALKDIESKQGNVVQIFANSIKTN